VIGVQAKEQVGKVCHRIEPRSHFDSTNGRFRREASVFARSSEGSFGAPAGPADRASQGSAVSAEPVVRPGGR
jgi:hypothetical protein